MLSLRLNIKQGEDMRCGGGEQGRRVRKKRGGEGERERPES